MSLRRKDSTGTTSAVDIEAPRATPIAGPDDTVAPSPMTPRRLRTANPILLARSLARGEDDNNPCGTRGLILLFRELTLGLMFGVFLLFTSIFLDHINIIHLESAHSFREAAFDLLNDPETMATIEEGAELKFLAVSEYEAMRSEIEGAAAKLEASARNLAQKEAEGRRKEEEIVPVRKEHERLTNDPDMMGLGRFCGECAWQGDISCGRRVQYLKKTYNNGEIEARLAVMKMPSCTGAAGKAAAADARGRGGGVDDGFCGHCTWQGNISCGKRVLFLKDTYGVGKAKARASAMETPSCKRG